MQLRSHRVQVAFPRRPLLMGIVNVNDDSFCFDGSLDLEQTLAHAQELAQAGADIIDIGAESARTNRGAIAVNEELARLEPVLQHIDHTFKRAAPRDASQVWPPLVSVNTWRTEVVSRMVENEAVDIINDLSGLPDESHAALCAQHEKILLIMHLLGKPKVPHLESQYDDVLSTLFDFFDERLRLATSAGLAPEQIVLDPGFDFAKQMTDNLHLLSHVDQIVDRYPHPILLPISRKTFIGEALGIEDPNQRDPGTVGCLAAGLCGGAHIFRVHNISAAFESLKVLHAVESVV